MYNISNDYQTKMFDQVQTHALSGLIGGSDTFSENDVIGVSITNRCSDKNVNVGSVNVGVLKLTFLRDLLERGNYYNKTISLSDSLLLGYDADDEPIWESVPLGTFYVAEATWRSQGMVDVVAYDCLSLMDIPLQIEQTSGYLYDFCKLIELHTGAVFGMTQEECEALPNGTALISPYPDNDMTTYRDLLSKLAQLVGGFGYADRDGSFRLKSFDYLSVLSIGNTRRFSGAKYSDFVTRFDGLSYQDVMTTGETFYIGDEDGVVMSIGANPFMQYGTPSVNKIRAEVIYNVVQFMNYTPYEVGLLPAFCALDLGDVVSFTNDYTQNTSSGAIMEFTWTYNKSIVIRCFGSNPNIRNAKSKTDHAVKGASSANKDGRVATFTATNIQEFTLDDHTKTEILKCLFTTSTEQPLLTLTEVKFETPDESVVEVFYYLDGEEIAYIPTETYSEGGLHTLSLMYPLEGLEIDRRHRFSVKMRSSSGATIQPLSARVYIQGTGFDLTGVFDGFVEVLDYINLIDFGYLEPLSFSEAVSSSLADNTTGSASDNLSLVDVSGLYVLALVDGVAVWLENMPLLAENSVVFRSEDGVRFLVEGE